MELRKRATAIIIKDGQILLMRRVKPNLEYYIFPGGGVEEGETIEEALIREVDEELSLDVVKYEHLFSLKNISMPQQVTIHKGNRNDYVFKVTEYAGTPELGGPEKEETSEENQYYLEWIDITKLNEIKNIYPEEVGKKLQEFEKQNRLTG
jgi:8-oxo-dGTP diphosphatase